MELHCLAVQTYRLKLSATLWLPLKMNRHRSNSDPLLRWLAVALIAMATVPASAQGASHKIWLAGVDPIVRPSMDPANSSDFMDLFQPNAPWGQAASHVTVFQISTQFASKASDEQLTQVITGLKRRHIALALAALMLSPGQGGCGPGIEGYSAPRQMLAIAKRIKKLGGELQYVAMDGPFMSGHFVDAPNACHSSVTDLAKEVTDKVVQFKSVFPAVQVGDIEPVGITNPANWVDAYMVWAKAYQDAVGEPLSFLHCDMQWHGPWQLQLRQLETRLRAAGVKVGVIYNGFGRDQTDNDWTQHAEEHLQAVESAPGLPPDQVIIQTWNRHPAHFLPETQPGTLTNLVQFYVNRQ
jgi:hypothetical protein